MCETSQLRLTSIAFVQADELKVEKVYMPRIGPQLTNCSDIDLNHWGPIRYIRIFRENDRVSGMGVIFYQADVALIKIGYGTADYQDYTIEEDDVLRGFYGEATDEYISELGLIVESAECTGSEILRLEQEEQKLKEEEG